MVLMPGIQKQSHEPLPQRHTTEHETRVIQLVETNEAPPVKHLDGEVTSEMGIPSAGGRHRDVRVAWLKKRSGEKVEVEKVSLDLATSTPLIGYPIGGLENNSSNQFIQGGA